MVKLFRFVFFKLCGCLRRCARHSAVVFPGGSDQPGRVARGDLTDDHGEVPRLLHVKKMAFKCNGLGAAQTKYCRSAARVNSLG